MLAVEKIREIELTRIQTEKDPSNNAREERLKMGYVGQPEGVALDIEHITIDAIQEVNRKKGKLVDHMKILNDSRMLRHLKISP